MVVSQNGNHRAMACILSGVGVSSSGYLSSVWDLSALMKILEPSGISKYASHLGKSFYDLGILMLDNSKRYRNASYDSRWIANY